VFSGDYLQFSFQRDFPPSIEPFNHLLKDLGYDRIPSIAVEGDVEAALGKDWYALFAGLPVTILDPSSRTSWQEIDIVGLSMRDSKKGLWSQPSDPSRFTVILGHNPNFSLKRPEADLYLAGHTHGGQVQLPLIGPLITLSDVPRDQAHGRSELENGATMIVSRGIGMERYDAPRLRFLCLPEIVVIDLQPST
ncbi:MAG: hypothetical protein VX278_01020, partial [Myxococcota bacterium]|nr:hypothetical protein [Myxococcota bacterium]